MKREEKETELSKKIDYLAATTSDAPVRASQNFFRDIVSSGGELSLARFQMVGWTLALILVFVASVVDKLSMPEFSATLLGLMGLSSGTYVGFKFPTKDGK
ncbi:hypothetical protein [Nitratireductor sp. XY-223]|uniref:hypothetical protein n=1 Tax=Nitratireductor sp. XY-223 TaxID=2561926 RepID=UPI0010A9E86E|nr:hypothetical protein [Nitratireductor sp. XY-223]